MRRLAFLAASLLLLLPAPAGAAKARIKAVTVTPASVAPGDAVRVRVTVAGGKAGRVTLLLSADARRSSGDQRVRRLKVPGRKGKRVVKASVDLPSAGSFRVLACLKKRCRASAPIRVVAPSAVPPAATPAPAQPTATAQPTPSAAPTVTASPTAEPTATPTPPPPGFDPAATPAPSDALDVTPTLESDRAVTEVVDSEEGGTITATAAGGATFTLTIPPAGLFEDEAITLTPVAGLAGLPIAAAPAAVDIQPHGLDLGEPATLTITPAAAIPVADQFTFAAREGGLDVHGFPPTASTSAIELPLTHFSIYGAAAATDAEVAEVTGRVAVDAQAQFEAEISGLLQESRRTGEEYDTTEIAAIMRRLFDTVVRPRLIAAESDDTLAVLAVGTFFGWDRQRQLLGDDGSLEGLSTEGRNRVETIIEYAYDVAVGRCLGGDLGAGGSLMQLARQAALLGVDLDTSVYTDLESCLRFEIDYEVGLQVVNPRPFLDDTEYTDVTVTATDVPLTPHVRRARAVLVRRHGAARGGGVRLLPGSPGRGLRHRRRRVRGQGARRLRDAARRAQPPGDRSGRPHALRAGARAPHGEPDPGPDPAPRQELRRSPDGAARAPRPLPERLEGQPRSPRPVQVHELLRRVAAADRPVPRGPRGDLPRRVSCRAACAWRSSSSRRRRPNHRRRRASGRAASSSRARPPRGCDRPSRSC